MPAPAIEIRLDGRDLTDRLRPVLSTLTLKEDRDSDADELEIVLVDKGRTPLPPKGAVITLALGYQGRPLTPKGTFRIDQRGLSGSPDIMTLKARSANFTADLTVRRDQTWRGGTLGDVLGEVAARQGLQAVIAPELAALATPLVDQSRESDAALVRRLGRRHDAVATIKAGRLLFAPIGRAASAGGLALPDFEIRRADGDQHVWEEADRDSYVGVSARWHDVDAGETRTVQVGGADDQGRRKRMRKTYASEADARQAGQAEVGRLRRGAATLRYALAVGRPDLFPERRGRVTGFGHPEIDSQAWLIARATHTWGDTSATTAIELETAAP
ncbi:contractile injection system protein, VgrG/Pvc8 family [Phenylobacterium sp.]|uniref:contractile injection system protein, VgrG/Pvc8 family n=1 Tax=Phenylobacterium sp. TaxID=1871053 RepID=UPI00301DC0EB